MSQDTTYRIQKARIFRAFFYICIALTTACSSVNSRIDNTQSILAAHKLQPQTTTTKPFPLFTVQNNHHTPDSTKMTLIIEGDGYSWASRYRLSDNPTPKDPIGLKILTRLTTPAIYLARPCQYITGQNCTPAIWSYDRFNHDVLTSYMNALDGIAKQQNITEFNLIGFSGGAYIALLLAAKRSDIPNVTTIAGVLNPGAWTKFHKISALRLNDSPRRLLTESANTEFIHACSHNDEIMPCELTQSFVKHAQSLDLKNHTILEFNDQKHTTLWLNAPLQSP